MKIAQYSSLGKYTTQRCINLYLWYHFVYLLSNEGNIQLRKAAAIIGILPYGMKYHLMLRPFFSIFKVSNFFVF